MKNPPNEETMAAVTAVELPNPFHFKNGGLVSTPADWALRRTELRDLIVETQYGGLPPAPLTTQCEYLHNYIMQNQNGAQLISCRVITGADPSFSFTLQLFVPAGDGPFPVVLNGDACWRYAGDEVIAEILGRGCLFAQFNRTEIASDVKGSNRSSGLYTLYPEASFGALAAWAWGYHRCVDVLTGMNFVDSARIAITGHSRGGKASLLAGATDERIALTCANNSGAGGAGSYLWQVPGSEKLSDLLLNFPHWLNPGMQKYAGRENELPFDQHYLKSLLAPRALLTTEALGDLWANPSGTWQTHLAAREIYRFLSAEDRIGIRYREGDHGHGLEDWKMFLDFMDWQLRGLEPGFRYDENPFPDLQAAFTWSVPCNQIIPTP